MSVEQSHAESESVVLATLHAVVCAYLKQVLHACHCTKNHPACCLSPSDVIVLINLDKLGKTPHLVLWRSIEATAGVHTKGCVKCGALGRNLRSRSHMVRSVKLGPSMG